MEPCFPSKHHYIFRNVFFAHCPSVSKAPSTLCHVALLFLNRCLDGWGVILRKKNTWRILRGTRRQYLFIQGGWMPVGMGTQSVFSPFLPGEGRKVSCCSYWLGCFPSLPSLLSFLSFSLFFWLIATLSHFLDFERVIKCGPTELVAVVSFVFCFLFLALRKQLINRLKKFFFKIEHRF